MKPVIRVESLGKRYRLSSAGPRAAYRTLRDSLATAATAPLRRLRNGKSANTPDEFWALKDVSFDVQPGEVVGIVGRNGAGKSTLLKVLSRITEPTSGTIRLSGRIASLLEVGTGFHPELTGRENIFLNGSILGMSRAEISQKFDAIVDFSGVERFLDTPVKRYSSGMQVRLAFAVAAYLEPEILVVDEVLAVGDIAFQNKCLARMQEITTGGRTILFVSHNMTAVQSLCSRGILLANGTIVRDGSVDSVIDGFLASMAVNGSESPRISLKSHNNRRSSSQPILQDLCISSNGVETNQVQIGSPVTFTIGFELPEHLPAVSCVVFICKEDGQRVVTSHSRIHAQIELVEAQTGTLQCHFPELPLAPNTYRVDVAVASTDQVFDYIDRAACVTITPGDYLGTGELPADAGGAMILKSQWALRP